MWQCVTTVPPAELMSQLMLKKKFITFAVIHETEQGTNCKTRRGAIAFNQITGSEHELVLDWFISFTQES